MLLTIPWNLSLIAGRVDLVDGVAQYKRPAKQRLTKGWSLTGTGISAKPIVAKNAIMMLATALPCYLIIQVPAFIKQTSSKDLAHFEWPYAIVGLVLCVLLFCYYLYF